MPLQRWQTMLEEPLVDGFEEGFFAVETCTLAVLLTLGAGGVATCGEDFSILVVVRGGKDLPELLWKCCCCRLPYISRSVLRAR